MLKIDIHGPRFSTLPKCIIANDIPRQLCELQWGYLQSSDLLPHRLATYLSGKINNYISDPIHNAL